jgi:DNA-binding transcriptional LysR family regulator
MVQLLPSRTLRDRASVAYERAGIEREVVLAVPTFTAAAAVAASTDLVATLPSSFLARHGSRLGLCPVKGPVPAQDVPICLCWHERTHTDPAMVAFRTLVRRAIRS